MTTPTETQETKEMKIVVLAGGTSTERSVSITSGTMVCKALREKNHQAVLVDVFCGIDVKGNLEDVFAEEAYDIDKAAEYMHSFDAGLNEMIASRRRFFGPNVLELCEAADVVFLALHGANGEDGKVQATFDLLGIPYTGTGYLSSALAMDKSITKQFFRAHHVPTPNGVTLKKGQESEPLSGFRKTVLRRFQCRCLYCTHERRILAGYEGCFLLRTGGCR